VARRKWTKSGKAPDTSLKCLNCPKLLEHKRRWMVLAVALFSLWIVSDLGLLMSLPPY